MYIKKVLHDIVVHYTTYVHFKRKTDDQDYTRALKDTGDTHGWDYVSRLDPTSGWRCVLYTLHSRSFLWTSTVPLVPLFLGCTCVV